MSESDIKLGCLLADFGMVREADVKRALRLSDFTALPIGKSLVLLGCIDARVLRASVEAQSMLREKLLDSEIARDALSIVSRKRWDFADALISLGVDASAARRTRFGELLVEARVLSEDQIDLGLKISDFSGLQLGSVLVSLDSLPNQFVLPALGIQRDLRAGELERDDAVESMRRLLEKYDLTGSDLSQSKRVKIGELLVQAEIISQDDIRRALEVASKSRKLTGQVLISQGCIQEEILIAAVRLQEFIKSSGLSLEKASSILREIGIKYGAERLSGVYNLGISENVCFLEFLELCGYGTKRELESMVFSDFPEGKQGWENSVKEEDRPAKVLEILGKLRSKDKPLLQSAMVIYELVRSQKLNYNEAILNYSMRAALLSNVILR